MAKHTIGYESSKTINHFTNVGCLKRILAGGLRFSDGTEKDEYGNYKWEDKNDAMAVDKYKQATGMTPYIICFIPYSETLHHWKYYGSRKEKDFTDNDNIKCYIAYNTHKLIKLIKKYDEYKPLRDIEYKFINELEAQPQNYSLDDILYIKRKGFRVDFETRLVCCSPDNTAHILSTEANECIEKIVIAPDATEEQATLISQELAKTYNFLTGRIYRSTLYYSENWEKAIDKIIANNLQNNK